MPLSMATISSSRRVMDLPESLLSAKEIKNKKSSKTNNKTKSPAANRSRHLVVSKEGTHRGGRELISITTGTIAPIPYGKQTRPIPPIQDGGYVSPWSSPSVRRGM
jgi:hypothetical protein